jgi:hypothetical protein
MQINNINISRNLYRHLIAVVVASFFLNISVIHFEPLAVWARLFPPLLLIIGLIGSVTRFSILRIGWWVGILMFFIVASATSFPSEDYVLGLYAAPGAGPPEVSAFNVCIRLLIGLTITTSLILTYRRAKPTSNARA